jgi:hypothetical protein
MKVLFIGNSFTARNDLPGMVARLAKAAGKRLEHDLISVGGASLRRHWNKGDARRAIETGGYDRVVLQEQSTLPVKKLQRFHDNVKLFDAAIRAAGAKTVLYMTWARRHAPETQQAISEAYTTIAVQLGAAVIPAGNAWARVLKVPGHPVLHDRDGSHPTVAGTYLAACCAFAVLFGRYPAGLEGAEGISTAIVARLHRAAWAECKPAAASGTRACDAFSTSTKSKRPPPRDDRKQ